jgi:hypothetical protein
MSEDTPTATTEAEAVTPDEPVLYYVDAARALAAIAASEATVADIHAIFSSELRERAISVDTVDRLRQRIVDLLGPGNDDVAFFLLTTVSLDSEEDELPTLFARLEDGDRLALQPLLRRLRGLYGHEYRQAQRSSNELPEDWVLISGTPWVRMLGTGHELVYELNLTRADGEKYLLRFRGSSLPKFLEYVLRTFNTALPQAAGLVSVDDILLVAQRASELVGLSLGTGDADDADESGDQGDHGDEPGGAEPSLPPPATTQPIDTTAPEP